VIWACKRNSALKVANKKEMTSLDWGTTMIIGLGDENLTLYVGCGKDCWMRK